MDGFKRSMQLSLDVIKRGASKSNMTEAERQVQELKESLFVQRMLNDEGYVAVRKLPTGEFAGVEQLLYTAALVVGMNNFGWERKYCYEKKRDAMEALFAWDGNGDPPGLWIKANGKFGEFIEERMNPNGGNNDTE